MTRNDYHRDDSAGGDSPSEDFGRSTWPIDADDPDTAALREGWSALDHLVRESNTDRWNDLDAARLTRSIERTVKHRRRRRASLALATAALIAVGVFSMFRSPSEEPIAESNAAPAPSIASLETPHIETHDVAPPIRAVASIAPSEWNDPLVAELEHLQSHADELELSWRRDGDRISHLQDRFEELQSEWSLRSL